MNQLRLNVKRDWHKVLSLMLKSSVESSKLVNKYYQNDNFAIDKKDDDSFITQADIESDQCIRRNIDIFENVFYLSEESNNHNDLSRLDYEYCWIVDPIDGTKEFINKTGEFGIMISLVYRRQTCISMISLPVYNSFYIAMTLSQHKYHSKLNLSNLNHWSEFSFDQKKWIDIFHKNPIPSKKLPNQYTLIQSSSHLNQQDRDYYDQLSKVKPIKLIRIGSCLKYIFIAENNAHEYRRFGTIKEWDVAAGENIVRAVGAKINTINNEPILFNSQSLDIGNFVIYSSPLW